MKRLFCLLIFLLLQIWSFAQEGAFHTRTGQALTEAQCDSLHMDQFDLFASDEPLVVTIKSDFKRLNKKRDKENYQEASMSFLLNDSIQIRRDVRIKARGNFRRNYCNFPPIKLNCKKSGFLKKELKQLKKVKLVVCCRKGKNFEQYLLKEYLIYKMFNLFTDKSFRVRLMEIEYVDTGRKGKSTDSYAFILEDDDDMAARNGAGKFNKRRYRQEYTERDHMTLVAVFEFMIGNTDWHVPSLHNVELIRTANKEENHTYVVPYDFDFNGMVNPPYAIPLPSYGIKTVRERLFQGYCREEAEFERIFDQFRERKTALYGLIESFPYLQNKTRKDMLGFLDGFFEIMESESLRRRYFYNACKKGS